MPILFKSVFPFKLKADQIHSERTFFPAHANINTILQHSIPNDPRGGRKLVYVPSYGKDFKIKHIDGKWMAQRMLEVCSANAIPLHYISAVTRHNNNNFILAKEWANIINANHRNGREIDLRMMELISTAHDFGRLVTGSSDARVVHSNIDGAYHGFIGFKIFGFYADKFLERGNFEAAKMCTDFAEICLYHSGFGYTSKDNKMLGLGDSSTIIHHTQHNPFYAEMALIALADTKSMYASYPEKKMTYEGPFSLLVNGINIILRKECDAIVFDTVSEAVLLRTQTPLGIKFKKLASFKDRSVLKIRNIMNVDNDIVLFRTGGLKASLVISRNGKDQMIAIDNLETIEIENKEGGKYTVDIVGYLIASRQEVHRRFDQFDWFRKPKLIDSIFDYVIDLMGEENAHLVNGTDHLEDEVAIPKK